MQAIIRHKRDETSTLAKPCLSYCLSYDTTNETERTGGNAIKRQEILHFHMIEFFA